jgi:hypothetical protein
MDMVLPDSLAFTAPDPSQGPRPLGWDELCARLVAAQDLRRLHASLPTGDAQVAGGSFNPLAATLLWRGHGHQDFVNPTSSSSGKDNQGNAVGSREPSAIACEQRQADENCHD